MNFVMSVAPDGKHVDADNGMRIDWSNVLTVLPNEKLKLPELLMDQPIVQSGFMQQQQDFESIMLALMQRSLERKDQTNVRCVITTINDSSGYVMVVLSESAPLVDITDCKSRCQIFEVQMPVW